MNTKIIYPVLVMCILTCIDPAYAQGWIKNDFTETCKGLMIEDFAVQNETVWMIVSRTSDDTSKKITDYISLLKYDGNKFTSYGLDTRSAGSLSKYADKRSGYFFSHIRIVNNTIWLYSGYPLSILKIENDSIFNYDVKQIPDRDNPAYFEFDNEHNIWLVYPPDNKNKQYRCYNSSGDVFKEYTFPFRTDSISIRLFVLFGDKKYFITRQRDEVKKNFSNKLLIVDNRNLVIENDIGSSDSLLKFEYYGDLYNLYILAGSGNIFVLDSRDNMTKFRIPRIDSPCYWFVVLDNVLYCVVRAGLVHFDMISNEALVINLDLDLSTSFRDIHLKDDAILGTYGIWSGSDCTTRGTGIGILKLR